MLLVLAIFSRIVTTTGQAITQPSDGNNSMTHAADIGRLAAMVRRHETQGEFDIQDEHLVRKRHVAEVAANGNSFIHPSVEDPLAATLGVNHVFALARRQSPNRAESRESSSPQIRGVAVVNAAGDSAVATVSAQEALMLDGPETAFGEFTVSSAIPSPLELAPFQSSRPDEARASVNTEQVVPSHDHFAKPNSLAQTFANAASLSQSVAAPLALAAITAMPTDAALAKASPSVPAAKENFPSAVVRKKKVAVLGQVLRDALLEVRAPTMQEPGTTADPASATTAPIDGQTTTALATPDPLAGSTTTGIPPATSDPLAAKAEEESATDWMLRIGIEMVISILLVTVAFALYKRWSTAPNNEGNTGGARQSVITNTDEEVVLFLKQVELFKRLPDESLTHLAKIVTVRKFAAGEPIINQGDEGNEFFMIKTGTARVEVDGQTVATLKSLDHFGENSLIRSKPREATIIGNTGIAAFTITRKQFFNLGLNEKLDFPKRMAVAQFANHNVEILPPSPKTPEEERLIIDAVRANKNLAFMHLTEKSMKAMAAVAWREEVATGSEIITQGTMPADYFYVVQKGSFLASIVGNWKSCVNISKGGSFGELALLYNAPRARTVTAREPSEVWVIARPHFKDVLLKVAEEYIDEYVAYLNNVELTKDLPDEQKIKIAKSLEEMTFKKGDFPFKQDDEGDKLFIMIEGTVDIIKNGVSLFRNGDYPIATAGRAVPFGEGALESEENRRSATVEILSEKARCLVLDKISYDILLGNQSPQRMKSRKFGEIKFKDLKRLGMLGCGGFGAVELVEHKNSGETFALKAQSKGFIVEQQMETCIINEKDLQLMCDSHFITKLFETYNGKESLYMLLELASGGEVCSVYNKKGLWGQVPHAKFNVAGVVFAFEHLHSKKILFRDLKPENMLYTEKGHVKLADLGLSKLALGKTYTTCGTPAYMAPEIIAARGTTQAADWWALGILVYELLAGYTPFNGDMIMAMFMSIGEGIEKVEFPEKCKGDVKKLIYGLCKHEPTERLPMKQGATDNVKEHAWYNNFDWDAMFNLKMDPPYVPQIKSKKDRSNFPTYEAELPPQVPYRDPGTDWDKNFATST